MRPVWTRSLGSAHLKFRLTLIGHLIWEGFQKLASLNGFHRYNVLRQSIRAHMCFDHYRRSTVSRRINDNLQLANCRIWVERQDQFSTEKQLVEGFYNHCLTLSVTAPRTRSVISQLSG